MSLVYVNGKISSPEEAVISVYDRGFLFGDAIYEVTRSYGKLFFALEPHIDRLYRSAEAIHLDIGKTKSHLIDEIYSFYKKSHMDNAYIRIQISRGSCKKEQISLFPENCDEANVVMYLHPLKPFAKHLYVEGQHLVSSKFLRNAKQALDPNIKSGNYLNNIMALLGVDKSKYNDSFLLNQKGEVTEGTTFNIFLVKNDEVITSRDDSDILQGITREIVMQEATKNGLRVSKRNFLLSELYEADEVFTTSSTKEVMPVTQIDGRKIGDGRVGPTTKRISSLYQTYLQTYLSWAEQNHPWK